MTVDQFLRKYVLRLEHEHARRDLTAVIDSLTDDDRMDLASALGYRRALEDIHAAAHKTVRMDRFKSWLHKELGTAGRQPGVGADRKHQN